MRNIAVLVFTGLFLVLAAFQEAESKRMELNDIRQTMLSLRKVCVPKSGVALGVVEAASKGNFAQDKQLMCYYKCVLNMIKAMKEDTLRVNVMLNQAELMLIGDMIDRVKNAVGTCGEKVTATDGCEKAWQFVKCSYEQDPEAYFLP